MTGPIFYNRAKAREAYSADRIFHVFSQDNVLFYNDVIYNNIEKATLFSTGAAWSPVWSPINDRIAFVANETGNDVVT